MSEASWSQPSAPGRTTPFIITRAKDRNSTARTQPEAREEGGGPWPGPPGPGLEGSITAWGPGCRLLPDSWVTAIPLLNPPRAPQDGRPCGSLGTWRTGPSILGGLRGIEDLLLQRAGPTKTPSVCFQVHYCARWGHAFQGCFPPLAKRRGNSKTHPVLGDTRLLGQLWLMGSLRQTLLRMH